jgi:hypothetical protein
VEPPYASLNRSNADPKLDTLAETVRKLMMKRFKGDLNVKFEKKTTSTELR